MRSGLGSLGLPAPDLVVQRLESLVQILETEGIEHGLLGPNEAGRVLERHVLESCALLRLIPTDSHTLIDVGSGGGLPGLPLACLGVVGVTLVDSQARRVRFLSTTVDRLGIEVDVRHARAEDLARTDLRESAGTVTARALADLPVALELTLPLTTPGGQVLIPATPPPDLANRAEATPQPPIGLADPPGGDPRQEPPHRLPLEASDPLSAVAHELGGGPPIWHPLEIPGLSESRWVLVVPKLSPTAERFPRRAGVPKRRPLG